MAKYEAHITMDKTPCTVDLIKEGVGGWQYSCIDDDPIMGQKPYCYLTSYQPDANVLKTRMDTITDWLKGHNVPVLRTKIERIIYDSKTGVDELSNPHI